MGIPNARLSVTYRDSEGSESVQTFYSEQDLDVIVGRLPDIKNILEGLTDATIARLEVTRQDPNPVDVAPGGNVDNEIQAQFTFRTTDDTVMKTSVPAFKRSLLVPNSNEVDITAGTVPEFLDMVLSNDPLGTRIVDSRAADTASLKLAVEAYSGRRSRRTNN